MYIYVGFYTFPAYSLSFTGVSFFAAILVRMRIAAKKSIRYGQA